MTNWRRAAIRHAKMNAEIKNARRDITAIDTRVAIRSAERDKRGRSDSFHFPPVLAAFFPSCHEIRESSDTRKIEFIGSGVNLHNRSTRLPFSNSMFVSRQPVSLVSPYA